MEPDLVYILHDDAHHSNHGSHHPDQV